ncbi:MAG: hypothetical protein LBF40_05530 [Deltaproteobacteria bacterium]|nr:hypothetical protein [Deltaproteobacteria bacterium]
MTELGIGSGKRFLVDGPGPDQESHERSIQLLAATALDDLKGVVGFMAGGLPPAYSAVARRMALALEGLLLDVRAQGGSGPVHLRRRILLFDGGPCLALKLSDWGEPFDPFKGILPDPPDNPPKKPIKGKYQGGQGARLALSLSQHRSYSRSQGANLSELYFLPNDGDNPQGDPRAKEAKDAKEANSSPGAAVSGGSAPTEGKGTGKGRKD